MQNSDHKCLADHVEMSGVALQGVNCEAVYEC